MIDYPTPEVEDKSPTMASYDILILSIDDKCAHWRWKGSKFPWIDRKLTIFHKDARFKDILRPGRKK